MTATITRSTAPAVAEVEDHRFLELIRSLDPDDWRAPTDCTGWDVRAMVLHVLGAAEAHKIGELLHQLWSGRKAADGRDLVDGMNDVQIADREHLTPDEIVRRLEVASPKFLRFRRRLPGPIRAMQVPAPGGWISMGRLMDTIYTRDSFMHRIDIHRAIARPFDVDEHERRIVADVVDEWARNHGQPYSLVLTGPAGGTFASDEHGERDDLDAVEFCRIVSGRATGSGLLATPVLF